MSNYLPTTVPGESRVRASRLVIDSPLGGVPSFMAVEEELINMADGSQKTVDKGNLHTSFDDLREAITYKDPDTGTIRSIEVLEMAAILEGYYVDKAKERDAAILAEAEKARLAEEAQAAAESQAILDAKAAADAAAYESTQTAPDPTATTVDSTQTTTGSTDTTVDSNQTATGSATTSTAV